MTEDPVRFGEADLTSCDREPIHTPGSVQPHGCLLALDPADLRIVQAGGDTARLLGRPVEALLSVRLSEVVSPRAVAATRDCLEVAPRSRRLFTMEAGSTSGGLIADATAHTSNGLLVLELEPAVREGGFAEDGFGLVQDLVRKVQRATSVAEFLETIVTQVRDVSGFDRVMLYRFLPDGAGAVEAESLSDDLSPYLGLRYPASDIPRQARELYLRNTVRLIPDARYSPAPILAAPDWDAGTPLDLSDSVLRSVSPIHLEYLGNMGVTASMSLSLVVEGRLWGLIACHHRRPRFLPSRIRVALDLFVQMASFQLETRLAGEALEDRIRSKAGQDALIADLAGQDNPTDRLLQSRQMLLDHLPAAGLALWVDGEFASIGRTPGLGAVMGLVDWMNGSVASGIFETDHLSSLYPPASTFAAAGAGVLAISISRVPRDYLIWFRPEQIETVRWAGDPNKPVTMDDQGGRLSPRKSFADWKQEVRGRSAPWSAFDVKTAESLRVSLLEVVLAHVDQLARERQRARVQQDALLAQLDERIAQWERTAAQLKVESDRRAVVEVELSEVLRRTVVVQEEERQRIARELHDSLGQYLTAMQMDLDRIAHDTAATTSIRDRVEHLRDMTAEAGREVNHLAWEIRPTVLDDLGLQTALQQLLEQWSERTTLNFDLHLTLDNRRLNLDVETALYRVVQEAIHNVVKHADASRVGVILSAGESEVRLIVEDDGKGFQIADDAAPRQPASRLGLLGMRERVAHVGGKLEIETAPGHGTTLLIHVPI